MATSDGRDAFSMFGGFRARHQFAARYFPESKCESTRTRILVHREQTGDDCRRLAERYGLVVFCGDSAPPDLVGDLLSIPLGVDMEMSTPSVFEGPGASWSRSAKANIAKVKRGRFDFDVVKGDEWVTAFYRRMFRPSMSHRHGAQASIETRRGLARHTRAPGSELVRLFRDGRWIAGCLSQSTPTGYRLLKLGWLNGDEGLLRSGAVSALYWFNFRRAEALGHSRILLGSVSPYLEDGLLRYKSHWGARLAVDGRRLGEFRLLLEPSHPACLSFLQAHSMVTVGSDGALVVFSGCSPDLIDVPRAVLTNIKRWYTWRSRPSAISEVIPEDVPRPLRPWVSLRGSPEFSRL